MDLFPKDKGASIMVKAGSSHHFPNCYISCPKKTPLKRHFPPRKVLEKVDCNEMIFKPNYLAGVTH